MKETKEVIEKIKDRISAIAYVLDDETKEYEFLVESRQCRDLQFSYRAKIFRLRHELNFLKELLEDMTNAQL